MALRCTKPPPITVIIATIILFKEKMEQKFNSNEDRDNTVILNRARISYTTVYKYRSKNLDDQSLINDLSSEVGLTAQW